jgi:hypothetical protein
VAEGKAKALSEVAAERERNDDGTLARSAITDGEIGRDYAAEHARRSSTRLGAEIGIGRIAVEKADRIMRYDPALALRVANGAVKATEALRQIKKAEVRGKVAALPEGKFRVIYADPASTIGAWLSSASWHRCLAELLEKHLCLALLDGRVLTRVELPIR